MTHDRAAVWLTILVLLAIGIILGQEPVMMIAATAAIALFYQRDRISLP